MSLDSDASRLLPNDYTTRLARVAIACNSTIMKLTSIAEGKEEDEVSDSNSGIGGGDNDGDYISSSTSHINNAFRRSRPQREFGQGLGKGKGQGSGQGQGSGFGLSLSSMTDDHQGIRDQGIRDITLHFHQDHEHDMGGGCGNGGGNGGGSGGGNRNGNGGNRNDRRSGTNIGSPHSAFNTHQSARQDASHPTNPAVNIQHPWTADGQGLLMMSRPRESDFDQEGALNRLVDDTELTTYLCVYLHTI